MAKEKKKRVKPVLEAVDETGQTKFARALGSVDSYTRERGLKALAKWLSAHEDVGKDDLIKIWKGIFYCFWHSDLQPVQAHLATRLGGIILAIPAPLAVRYHDAFVETMRREWFGIDRLRLDKFMMLVRRIMHTMFVLLASRGWPKAEVLHCCEQWMALLLPNTSGLGVGLSYHVTDIFLTELEGAAAEAADASDLDRSQAREMGVEEGQEAEVPAKKAKKPKDGQPSSETLVLLLSPFIRALSVSSNPVLVQRLHVDVFQPLVSYARSPKSAPVVYANLDARLLAASLFERGALPETRSRNRRALYAVSSDLERAAARRSAKKRAAEEELEAAVPAVPELSAAAPSAACGVELGPSKKRAKAKAAERAEPKAAQSRAAEPKVAEPKAARAAEPKAAEPKAAEPKAAANGRRSAVPAAGAAAATPSKADAAEAKVAGRQATPGVALSKKAAKAEAKHPPAAVAPKASSPPAAATPRSKVPAAPAAETTPKSATLRAANPPPQTPRTLGDKKNVRFSLKQNLVNTIGQPPLPADVRTPPRSQPKGSALKKISTVTASAPARRPGSRLGNGAGGSGKPTARRLSMQDVGPPRQRVRAADFF